MCARFDFLEETYRTIEERADSMNPEIAAMEFGMVRPSMRSAVLAGHKGRLHAGIMAWGLPRYDGKGLVINTRTETAWEKPMFAESMEKCRCIIPAAQFYEWNPAKEMVTFSLAEQQSIFMAGLYNVVDGAYRYSVLTQNANASVSKYHDRMPVILEDADLEAWVFDGSAAKELVRGAGPALNAAIENEQMCLY